MNKKLAFIVCMLIAAQPSYADWEDDIFFAGLKVVGTLTAFGGLVYYFVRYGNEESPKQIEKDHKDAFCEKKEVTPFRRSW